MENTSLNCASFINQSSTAFQAIQSIKTRLLSEGFIELSENHTWELVRGNKYFTTRNKTSVIAFTIGQDCEEISFNMSASHSDACAFKIKPLNTIHRNGYVSLNTEGYGGMNCSTWLDRPLSIGGRVMIEKDGKLSERVFDIKEPCCIIPNMAMHINRDANTGMNYNKQIDMAPVMAMDQKEFDFKKFLAKKLNESEESISFFDAYLYNPEKCLIWGEQEEFFSGPRLDDLQMAFVSMEGFLASNNTQSVNVFCCFDNEEVGSRTRQGAASSYLKETLKRIVFGLNQSLDDYYASLARSFMVSCDNAHAIHPNHPEKADQLNQPKMNHGPVVKFNAAQSYTSDSLSAAYFKVMCDKAGIPFQTFTNRSDLVGGGTLGNISASQVSVASVDIGIAQLAMHSTYETSGTKDMEYCVKVMKTYYDETIKLDVEGNFILTK